MLYNGDQTALRKVRASQKYVVDFPFVVVIAAGIWLGARPH